MAHSRFFKEYLKRKLKKDLRQFHILRIKDEYELSIFNYLAKFWDFKIDLSVRNIGIILELETGRREPVNNLIKTLIWVHENRPSDPIILLHFFDAATYAGATTLEDETCKKLWDFIDKENMKNLIYGVYLIENLTAASLSRRKTKKLVFASRRVSQIIKRVIGKVLRNIEERRRVN